MFFLMFLDTHMMEHQENEHDNVINSLNDTIIYPSIISYLPHQKSFVVTGAVQMEQQQLLELCRRVAGALVHRIGEYGNNQQEKMGEYWEKYIFVGA